MSNTELFISTEDFVVECPLCGDIQETLNIVGRFLNPIQCNGCYEFFKINIEVEPD